MLALVRILLQIMSMKTALLAVLCVASLSIQAQVGTSPRTLTKRIEPQIRPQPPRYIPPPAAGTPAAAATAKPLTAKEAEQKKLEESAEAKKKLQWQMERAEKGSDPAQYALGMRYLNGEGVDKDLDKAKKWLREAAKNGNADARKKLPEVEAMKSEPKAVDNPAEPKK
jgi:TPR repeat protein